MKIFQREQRSLFGEILDWMLTPLLLLWPVSLALLAASSSLSCRSPYSGLLRRSSGHDINQHSWALTCAVRYLAGTKPPLSPCSSPQAT